MVIRLCIFCLLFTSGAECQMQSDAEFCAENVNTLFCAPGEYNEFKGACPSKVSRVNARSLDYNAVTKTLNDYRKDLAQGNTVYSTNVNEQKFPSAGDTVELEWSQDLEKAARMWARTCPAESYPNSEDRAVPGLPLVDIIQKMVHNTQPINDAQFITDSLEEFKDGELERLAPFAASNGEHDRAASINIYGKGRYVGCGRVSFRNDDLNRNEAFITCMFARGDIDFSPVQFGTPACTACPPRTNCSSTGPYAGILCAYSAGPVKSTSNFALIILAAFTTLLVFTIWIGVITDV